MSVAWMKGEGEKECDGARCDACEQDVPVMDGKYGAHVRCDDEDGDEDEAAREYAEEHDDDFNPDQPREETGKWSEGGGGGGGSGGGGNGGGSGGGGGVGGGGSGSEAKGGGEEKGKGEKKSTSEMEHEASSKFPGPKGLNASQRTAWYKEQTAKAKVEREKIKGARKALKKKKDAAYSLCDGSGVECRTDSVTLRGGKWVVLGASGKVAGIFGSREEAEAQEQALKEKSEDSAADLVAAWNGYTWEDNNTPAWPGKICPTCLNAIPIVEGKIAPHLRDAAAPWKPEEDHTCPGGGQEATADVAKRLGGCWVVVDPSVGKIHSSHQKREEALAAVREVQRAVGKKDGIARVARRDLAQLAPPTITADGFLQVEGRVARTGVQEYRNADGSTRRELRLPEEVSASVPGFALAPFTNDHPADGVTPENARDTVVGAVGDAQLSGDGWVTAPIRIYAADAIAATKGGRAQLSVGYSCRLDFVPGQWQGQKYDAVQREIVVNHVALVDLARAGSLARLRLDAATADLACDTPNMRTSNQENNRMPHELRIDGLVFQVNDPNAQAAYDRALKQRDDSLAAATSRVANADTLVATANKDRDTAQAARDNAVTELKTVHGTKISILGITVADALDEAKSAPALRAVVEAAAAERATLLLEARKHLGANERFDAYVDAKSGKAVPAKSDLEIKKLVVEKLDKDVKLDGKSADYVQARYDGLVEAATKSQPRAIDSLRATMNAPAAPTNSDAAPTDAQAARRAFEAKMVADNLGNAKRN